jgi:hypothetical protein
MEIVRITATIKTALYFIMLIAIMVACDTQQEMMHEGGRSMNLGNLHWVQILISLGKGFLLGFLVARRRR